MVRLQLVGTARSGGRSPASLAPSYYVVCHADRGEDVVRHNAALAPGHRRLSQRELATRAGLSLAAVRDLEQGRTQRPKAVSVRALIAALEVDDDVAAAWLSTADDGEPATGAAWVGVLVPIIVRRGEREVRLGPGRRRAFLARLAVAGAGGSFLPRLPCRQV